MKVMYYIHNLSVGGAETICTQCMIELVKRGIEVVLVIIDERDSFLYDKLARHGVRVVSICPFKTRNRVYNLLNNLYIRLMPLESWWDRVIEAEQPDLIHIHTSKIKWFRAKNFPSNKIVYTFHGHVDRYLNYMGERGNKILQHHADGGMKFFAISNKIFTDIKDKLHTNNVVYIPNGVNIDSIRNNKYKREEFLREIDIDIDSFILGHVARFHEVKNQDRTVKIFKEVLKIKPNACLLFIGECNNAIGRKIRNLVKREGLVKKVKFLGLREDASPIMSVIDAIVLPSLSESFSLVMVEAQVHNIRAVASMTVPESVICNDNCFRLSLEDDDEKWARYLTGKFTEKHNYNLQDFELNNVVDRLTDEYVEIAKME